MQYTSRFLFFTFFNPKLLSTLLFIVAFSLMIGCSKDDTKSPPSSPPPPPPTSHISIVAQEINTTITDPMTVLHFTVTSTFDIASFNVKINNIERNELTTLDTNILTITPTATATLPFDYLSVTLSITDNKDFVHEETFDYTIDFNTAIASGFSALPQTGYAPLQVTFTPKVSAEESIQLYHWDFGDGTLNDSNTSRENLIGSPVQHTYTSAGEYRAVLTIYDSNYQPATSELLIKVYNEAPVITALDASPSNGELPLSVAFSASATDNEGIREFLWDYNSDGVIDFNDSKADMNFPTDAYSSATYVYTDIGQYQATLSVVDVNGTTTTSTVPTISVHVGPEGTPSVTASASPSYGQAPLLVTLYSYEGYDSMAKWEWDFDGDGSYDYSSTTSGTVDHNYTNAGTFYPQLKATATNGMVSFDNLEVTVGQNMTLTRSSDTIDVKNAESVTLQLSVAAEAETRVIVENHKYQTVKTLLDWDRRSGTITLNWDGSDENGVTVAEGDYYIVLLYKEGGETKRFDLRDTRNSLDIGISTNISAGDVFAPYVAPMMIEFNLSAASEVSLDIGPDGYSVTERIKTLLLKKPLGKGVHTILWAGDANDGTLADLSKYKDKYPSGANYYMTGGFMNQLADNAVYVNSGVSVLDLKSDIPIYIPNAIGADQSQKLLSISFKLTAPASVTLTLNDAQSGATVLTKQITSLPAGAQSVAWDGKDANGKYIAPGVYRIGVKATDSYGYTSLTQYALQRIFY